MDQSSTIWAMGTRAVEGRTAVSWPLAWEEPFSVPRRQGCHQPGTNARFTCSSILSAVESARCRGVAEVLASSVEWPKGSGSWKVAFDRGACAFRALCARSGKRRRKRLTASGLSTALCPSGSPREEDTECRPRIGKSVIWSARRASDSTCS